MAAGRIPFLDLGAPVRELRGDIDAAITRVLDSGWYLLGRELQAFESDFAAYVAAPHCVGLANGLDDLRLSLVVAGVGAGDEVIVPSNTYIATWLAVSQVGAVPVPVEPVEGTCNLDPARLAERLTARTRAIMPVHLYGQSADLDPILALARPRGIPVIEDAAQCHGARYKGRRIGAHGDLVCWSFYPTKNLGALGDAGAVTTARADFAERLRVLRNYGSKVRYVCDEAGVNSRLEEIHAAVLRVKLAHLDDWNGRRCRIAAAYQAAFAGLPGLRLPEVPAWAEPVWHLYVVRHARREALREHLERAGIGAIAHYPIPPHAQKAYAGLGLTDADCPIAARLHRDVLSLPCHPQLSEAEVAAVIAAVREACTALG
jgi:dTDP-4-amino-4,6-dideoxygalactose transaminase